MRRSDETNKTVGYVVVPLFIDSESEDDIENEIQGSKFEEIDPLKTFFSSLLGNAPQIAAPLFV
jgi:hypothetical protein